MNVATMGRILLKEYPEIASEIIANNPKIIRLSRPKKEAVTEALLHICYECRVDPDKILAHDMTSRNHQYTEIRRLVSGVALKLYQPEALTERKRKRIDTELNDILKGVFIRDQKYVSWLTTYTMFNYKNYTPFRSQVDMATEYILNFKGLA